MPFGEVCGADVYGADAVWDQAWPSPITFASLKAAALGAHKIGKQRVRTNLFF